MSLNEFFTAITRATSIDNIAIIDKRDLYVSDLKNR